MADLLTTLHPINDENTDLYPNVKRDNLPQDVKDELNAIPNKVDKVQGKGLSTNDFTNADKALVDTIPNKVDKVTGKGLSTNDFTNADKALVDTIPDKVNKEQGKGLSTNDFTNVDKNAVEVAIPLKLSFLNTNILDLYRMVIRSGGMITVTDASVALTSQTFPMTVSPKALLNYVGGMCKKIGDSIITAPMTSVKSMGANVINWSLFPAQSHTSQELGGGFEIDSDGVWKITGGATRSYVVNPHTAGSTPAFSLKAGTYKFSLKVVNGTVPTNQAIVQIKSVSDDHWYPLKNGDTFTLPQNDGIMVYAWISTTAGSFSFMPMLSRGTNAVEYTPYRAPIYYPIHRDIRALDGYGWGIDGDCYNYIDFERKVFVKKVAQYAFQSGEWAPTAANRFYTSSLRGMIKSSTLNLIALGLTTVTKSSVEIEDYQIGVDVDGTIYVHLTDSSTLADVEAFFGGKSIYFELATPVETDISDLLRYTFPTYDIINVLAGGYLEFENENNIGVPYSVTYQSKPDAQTTVQSIAPTAISEVVSNDPDDLI